MFSPLVAEELRVVVDPLVVIAPSTVTSLRPSPRKLPTVRSQTNFSAPRPSRGRACGAGALRGTWADRTVCALRQSAPPRRRFRVATQPSRGAAHAPACAESPYTEPPCSSPPFSCALSSSSRKNSSTTMHWI
eukprot:7388761-Prymnesium_polylepis.1